MQSGWIPVKKGWIGANVNNRSLNISLNVNNVNNTVVNRSLNINNVNNRSLNIFLDVIAFPQHLPLSVSGSVSE